MATVHRNGRIYIYRSVRQGGKVTSEYGGSGESAWLIAQMERIRRDERDCERRREQEERRELDVSSRLESRLASRPRGPSAVAARDQSGCARSAKSREERFAGHDLLANRG